MVHITMEIVTTRDIARQMLRHRSFSFLKDLVSDMPPKKIGSIELLGYKTLRTDKTVLS